MNRLECFNVAASTVLQRLLEKFPQPVVLDARALQEEIAAGHSDCAIEGGPGNPGNLVSWTVRFLIDEGYVRASDPRGPTFVGATLTSRGFAALSRRIEALDPLPTLGSRLLEAGQAIAPEVAGAIIGRLLG